jgi:lathosterol oxidase
VAPMDLVLDYADAHLLDSVYANIPGLHGLERESLIRQSLSLFAIVLLYANVFYFSFAGFNYYFLYDKTLMKHPKFLKDQASFLIYFPFYSGRNFNIFLPSSDF